MDDGAHTDDTQAIVGLRSLFAQDRNEHQRQPVHPELASRTELPYSHKTTKQFMKHPALHPSLCSPRMVGQDDPVRAGAVLRRRAGLVLKSALCLVRNMPSTQSLRAEHSLSMTQATELQGPGRVASLHGRVCLSKVFLPRRPAAWPPKISGRYLSSSLPPSLARGRCAAGFVCQGAAL